MAPRSLPRHIGQRLLNGQPIEEPIVGQGPFVMNTRAEIDQAVDDYRNGRMGRLAAHA
jgi:hypothetical protein